MNLYIRKPTVKRTLNKALRITQRTEVTKLSTRTVTIRNCYKNKQIIEVASDSITRCLSPI
jgi:hypothetical protein